MENDIKSTLGTFSNSLEEIREQEMDRFRKEIKNSDREKINLISSIVMAKIVSRLENKLKLEAKKGKSENLAKSIEMIFSLEVKSNSLDPP